MSTIKIYEIYAVGEKITIAGLSTDNVKDYIMENKNDFPDIQGIELNLSMNTYDMEVTYYNTNIELLHTVDKINLINEEDNLYEENIPYTYELDTILVDKNTENKQKILIDSFDDLFL